MTEAIMYAAIGFLIAVLLGVAVIPLVHQRAIRLTMRRIESSLPIGMAEIQAEKDGLRADFAIAMRRLEIANEQLRTRLAQEVVRVSQKAAMVTRMKSQISEQRDQLAITPAGTRAKRERAQDRRAA